MRSLGVVSLTFLLVMGCGATSTPTRTTAAPSDFDPLAFLMEIANSQTELLRAPDESVETLMERRTSVSGAERRQVLRDLARAHLALARTAEGREARRHREAFARFSDSAVNGSRDDHPNAEMAFLEVWLDFETEGRNAASRAERFTTRHDQSGDLLVLVWMIRGELALRAEDWEGARAGFRFVLGQLGHPLYAYALYRTAFAWHSAGDDEQARQALEEAAALGCDGSASEPTRRMALLAAHQLGLGLRAEDGRNVPETCPTRDAETAEGWRPPE